MMMMMLRREFPSVLGFQSQTSLSCGLPISGTEEKLTEIASGWRSIANTDEELEFILCSSLNLDAQIRAADEIFHRAKILPFGSLAPYSRNKASSPPDSLEKDPLQGKKNIGALWRPSRSDGYKRMRSAGSGNSPQKQAPRRPVSGGGSGRGVPRPKWYLPLFGLLRLPAETDITDIRCRIRSRSALTPPATGDGEAGKRKWKLLRALTCRAHEKVET